MLMPVLSVYADVVTAGRSGCDMCLNLSDPIDEILIPDGIDVVINTASHFGSPCPHARLNKKELCQHPERG
jgi:hypothetical protein